MVRTPSAEYLIIDIETIPDTDRWTRPETVDASFPPTWAHRIIVVGCLWLDHGYRLKRFGVIGEQETPSTGSVDPTGEDPRPATEGHRSSAGEGPRTTLARGNPGGTGKPPGSPPRRDLASAADHRERRLLEDFSRFVGRARPVLVTYNGRSFDLPVIVMRSLCHAISLPWYYRDRDIRYRYSEDGHLDLCDWLADHGATRAGKLDALTRLIGLPGKVGVDGSQVEGLYRAGQHESIQKYCLADVAQTALLFLRFRLLQGQIAPETYRERTNALLDALAADGRVTEILDQLNRQHLLGPTPPQPPPAASTAPPPPADEPTDP